MGEENTSITHPGSEELEENGLSVSLGSEVIRGELKSRGGGCRKGKEEGSLFHHCCFELFFVIVWTWFWRVENLFWILLCGEDLALLGDLESRVNVPGSRGAALNLLKSKCINLTLDQDLEGN